MHENLVKVTKKFVFSGIYGHGNFIWAAKSSSRSNRSLVSGSNKIRSNLN